MVGIVATEAGLVKGMEQVGGGAVVTSGVRVFDLPGEFQQSGGGDGGGRAVARCGGGLGVAKIPGRDEV